MRWKLWLLRELNSCELMLYKLEEKELYLYSVSFYKIGIIRTTITTECWPVYACGMWTELCDYYSPLNQQNLVLDKTRPRGRCGRLPRSVPEYQYDVIISVHLYIGKCSICTV